MRPDPAFRGAAARSREVGTSTTSHIIAGSGSQPCDQRILMNPAHSMGVIRFRLTGQHVSLSRCPNGHGILPSRDREVAGECRGLSGAKEATCAKNKNPRPKAKLRPRDMGVSPSTSRLPQPGKVSIRQPQAVASSSRALDTERLSAPLESCGVHKFDSTSMFIATGRRPRLAWDDGREGRQVGQRQFAEDARNVFESDPR